ncbi:MAG: sugar phosphate isomerase/epimerase [Anaerolineales bacterium]|nr:sugar phosphate isomerase/epimerase [Anaerolineales bacterium]
MINVRSIGISMEPSWLDERVASLETLLGQMADLGFAQVELDLAWLGVIVAGQLHQRRAERVLATLRPLNLRYSVHGIERLNLAYDPRHALVTRIMRAQIEFCRALGAQTLVYHSGLQALDDVRVGARRELLTDEELTAGAAQEVRALRELAPLAAGAGVMIGVENGDPHLWEYAALRSAGAGPEALTRHHARLCLPNIVRQLEAVDHPQVGLTLDVAHLYLAANAVGFDYLEAVAQAAPWVRHLHVNDNFGQLDRGEPVERNRWAFGEADLHLAPGWGTIPLREVFARLPNYAGDLILEIKPGCVDDLPEALANTRALLAAA